MPCRGFFPSVGFAGLSRILFTFSPVRALSKQVITLIGCVEECFPNATFRVRILSAEARDHELLCHLAGRMRLHRVRILPGDQVKIEMTPYDLQKGRITYRFRAGQPIDIETPGAAAESSPPPSPPSS